MTKKLVVLLLALLLCAGCALAEAEAPAGATPEPQETPEAQETPEPEKTPEPQETPEPDETPPPACPPHDLVELYRTNATCQSDGSVTRQCTRCGTLVVEALPATETHRWVDKGATHECQDCGLSEAHDFAQSGAGHLCLVCGAYAAHEFVSLGARQHGCVQCSAVGEHVIPEGSHACAECSYRTAHEYTGSDPHTCVICGEATPHEYTLADPHVCAVCGARSEHDYSGADPHVCVICGERTEHDYSGENPHECTICGALTEHDYSGADPHECVICGERTEHDYSGANPHECTICGALTEHDYSGEDPHECVICGEKTEHDFSGEDPHRCVVCGQRSDHEWERLTLEDGGLYQPTTTTYQCAICGVVIEKTSEPQGNPIDTDTAELAISDEDGYLILTEETAGQLLLAGRGMTFTLALDDPALYFAAPVSGSVLDAIGLSAENGLEGLNVFLADARLLEDGSLRLTLIATEARMNQPLSDEAGRVRLSLPVAGLETGGMASVRCVCGGTIVAVSIGAPEEESGVPESGDESLEQSGVGLTDYRIARDWVRMAADGRVWRVRLGSFTYNPADGGNPETRLLRPLILDGRLTFAE